MAACGQDAHWHAEGDVWTHTRMVCAELELANDLKRLIRAGLNTPVPVDVGGDVLRTQPGGLAEGSRRSQRSADLR